MSGQKSVPGFEITNADEFLASVKAAFLRLEIRSRTQLVRIAVRVVGRAQEYCPVDTGRLRSSIHWEQGEDSRGFFVDVGTNVKYAPFVEYGTRFQQAQSFMRPALAEIAGEMLGPAFAFAGIERTEFDAA